VAQMFNDLVGDGDIRILVVKGDGMGDRVLKIPDHFDDDDIAAWGAVATRVHR